MKQQITYILRSKSSKKEFYVSRDREGITITCQDPFDASRFGCVEGIWATLDDHDYWEVIPVITIIACP